MMKGHPSVTFDLDGVTYQQYNNVVKLIDS